MTNSADPDQDQVSLLLQKPTDRDLHCLQRQGISGFSRTRFNPICSLICNDITVKLQWLEHIWDHGNLFERWVVRANEI